MLEKVLTLLANTPIDASPLPQAKAESSTLQNIFDWTFAITAAIGVLIIVIAGIRFITSRGDPQAVAKAKNTIIYVAVGLIIMFFAYVIVSITLNVLGGNP